MIENVVLLGATGSVGKSVLDIIRHYPDRFNLIGVSGYHNLARLSEIIREFKPRHTSLLRDNAEFRTNHPEVQFHIGETGLSDLAGLSDATMIIIAVSGMSGLQPTLSAIRNGKNKKILSANKESIVAAGDVVSQSLKDAGQSIIPLDSEHNAVFNIQHRMPPQYIREICLTASGGPFLRKPIDETITISDVLAHPTWNMGSYITVNSATMMNKGFEVIEAHYLFHMDYSRIKVLIHPTSLVHGMVETIDGSTFMLASPSDMRYPVALAMFYPEIPPQKFKGMKLAGKSLEFEEPDLHKFPMLKLAYDSGKEGGILMSALNAANEVIVDAFLKGKIRFMDIPGLVKKTVEHFVKENQSTLALSLEAILDADHRAREFAHKLIA